MQTFQDSLLGPSFNVKVSEENAGVLGQGAVYTVCTIPSSSNSMPHTVPSWLLSGALWLTFWSSSPHCSMLMLVGALSWAPTSHAASCHLLSLSPLPCTVTAQTLYSCGHLSSHCISSFCILVHCHKRFYQPLTFHTASVAAFFLYILTLEDRTDMLPQNVTNVLII